MSDERADPNRLVYDKVALAYDELWSAHVAEPNVRLTNLLAPRPGERVVDLACGTALYTLEMARRAEPGQTVGVDPSDGRLAAARRRAAGCDVSLTLVQSTAEAFIAGARPASFDVVSLRFALAYLDWRRVLPAIGPMVKEGGRAGVLTSLADSIPQALQVGREIAGTFGVADVAPPVPADVEEVGALLSDAGLLERDRFTERIRLWFDDGFQVAAWLEASGYSTHPLLSAIDDAARDDLRRHFSAEVERFREARGVPLDLVIGGVVAQRVV